MEVVSSSTVLNRLKSLYPKSIDLKLNRLEHLLGDLNHPEQQLPPTVHIAGTNGKGSTLAMIRAGLEAERHRVHSYISPHLTHFNERITLAGNVIDEDALVDALLECEATNLDHPITLFEITTAAAFLSFSRVDADFLLLEVGLGGRLDATNVVKQPELTVITPISYDHEKFLGNTISEIAFEKAGIIKPSVPCVVAEQEPDAMNTIAKVAKEKGSPLLIQNRDWFIESVDESLVYTDSKGSLELPKPALTGFHQTINAGVAIQVLRLLDSTPDAIQGAMLNVSWPGRMQKLKKGPLVDSAQGAEVWLDGGHNPAAGIALARTLEAMPKRTNNLICGMLTTKDSKGYLTYLRKVASHLYGIEIPGESESMSANNVAMVAREVGFNSCSSASALEAVESIAKHNQASRILVCGSLYLAGTILRDNS
ncbi:MAG: bifunctional folylpolyglutamate synthase/dihydrofolate synthase [Rhodobacteraceae bacterium]|nr:bifunctional folylpolyglutamate synthase/dihydrofolate synthase [Paracoccaceae bacterium]